MGASSSRREGSANGLHTFPSDLRRAAHSQRLVTGVPSGALPASLPVLLIPGWLARPPPSTPTGHVCTVISRLFWSGPWPVGSPPWRVGTRPFPPAPSPPKRPSCGTSVQSCVSVRSTVSTYIAEALECWSRPQQIVHYSHMYLIQSLLELLDLSVAALFHVLVFTLLPTV